jgi:hypothetical protein
VEVVDGIGTKTAEVGVTVVGDAIEVDGASKEWEMWRWVVWWEEEVELREVGRSHRLRPCSKSSSSSHLPACDTRCTCPSIVGTSGESRLSSPRFLAVGGGSFVLTLRSCVWGDLDTTVRWNLVVSGPGLLRRGRQG